MNEIVTNLCQLLSEVVVPNLKSVQKSQSEQIVASAELERAIEELGLHMDSQFAQLTAQLTACQAELAATQALLKASQARSHVLVPERVPLVH